VILSISRFPTAPFNAQILFHLVRYDHSSTLYLIPVPRSTPTNSPFLFVPFPGAASTVGILGYGLYSFINQSNSGLSSARGMSMRVMMQGGTVAGLVAVFAYSGQGPFAPLHKKIKEWRGEPVSSSPSH
jgi:hypothetical protein